MNTNADIVGIMALLRNHIEIRNRSWMKTVYRDCFIGSEVTIISTMSLMMVEDGG